MKHLMTLMALVVGASSGYFFGKASTKPALTDLSEKDEIAALLPEDMVEAIRDDALRKNLISVWEQIGPQLVLGAGSAKSEPLALPAGVPEPPFLGMESAEEGVNWPDTEGLIGGEALHSAKTGWVVMNVWATWCAPCVAELPDVQNAATALQGDNITILTVNADVTEKDTEEIARQTLIEREAGDIPFIMADGAENIDRFIEQVFPDPDRQSFPYTVIYAPGGIPFATFSGGAVSDEAIWAGEQGLAFFRGLANAQLD